jgi:hypothetical protein
MSDRLEQEAFMTMNAQPTLDLGNGERATSVTLLVLGGIALVAGAVQWLPSLLRVASLVDNPVFGNARRLPHEQTMLHLADTYATSVVIVVPWLLLTLLLAGAYAMLLRRLYATSPQQTTLAAMFLGGSVLCALLIATSVLKVAEFAVQANAASAAEQEWLRAGVNFMNQLHLFYVSGWMLAAAAGWAFLGYGALAAGPLAARGARLLLTGGVLLGVSAAARMVLPAFEPQTAAVLVGLTEPLASVAFGAALIGSGWLLRSVPAGPAVADVKRSRSRATESPAPTA